MTHLLYFKLTLARPVERDITTPRVSKEDKRLSEGGDAGRMENNLKIAINIQLTT